MRAVRPETPRLRARPPREEFLVFGSPLIEDAEIDEVVATMRSGWLGTGPRVAAFEEAFRTHTGARYSLALNSCTAALHVAMLAAGVGPGDEVITTSLTFAATVNAIVHTGATPVLADCDPVTMNLDPERVAAAITPRTRAIIPVHFAGRPCDMDALMAIAEERGVTVIEDCAHAIEASHHGRPAGTMGHIGCFSFYVTKNIVTGEGGMLVTDDEAIADRAKVLSLHGMTRDAWRRFSDEGYRHYAVVAPGYKYNMMDLQAAIGLRQLDRLESMHARREEIWAMYDDGLAGLPCALPAPAEPDTHHARHLYTLVLDEHDRDTVLGELTARNIGVGVHYLPVHVHPYYREQLGDLDSALPNATRIGTRTLSIPLSAKLTDDDVADVVWALHDVLG
jgi:dTDP-4-amino-4,6-dideoxygalactose transaminase